MEGLHDGAGVVVTTYDLASIPPLWCSAAALTCK